MRFTFKAAQLSTVFITLVTVLMLALGLSVYIEIEQVRTRLELRQMANARNEIGEAIASVVKDIDHRANRMAAWDEAKQQLANKQYYLLWRESRLQASGLMSQTFDGVGLYDRKGMILAPDKPNGALPDHVPVMPPAYYWRNGNGRSDLEYFFPIYADPDRQILMGYGGFSFDLLAAIRHTRQFSFADPASFELVQAGSTFVDIDKLAGQVRFTLRPQQSLSQFIDVFRTGLIRLAVFALAILLLAASLVNRFLVRPIRLLSKELRELRATHKLGPADGYVLAMLHIEELDDMRGALLEYQQRVNELTDELEQSNRQLFHQAHHDALSGAFNRRAFDCDCRELTGSGSFGRYSLLLFDCDRFKSINDTYGHGVGDAVITAIAGCLQGSLRAEDKLYRLGGDEFAALLLDTTRDQTEAIVERCRQQIMQYDFIEYGIKDPIVLSTGIVLASPDLSFCEALRRADQAMYTAKLSPNHKVVYYEECLD